MPRRKALTQEPPAHSPRKRARAADPDPDPYDVPDETATPSKRARFGPLAASSRKDEGDGDESEPAPAEADGGAEPSPTKRKRGRPPRAVSGQVATPSALRQKLVVATPVKLNGINGANTPSRRNNADRSARRKSARALIDRVIGGAISDDEGEEDEIAREIYESSEEDEEGEGEQTEQDQPHPTTPSRRPGRPKGSTTARKRSPTPPRDLPPHEQYFYQNKPGLTKTSSNNLTSLDLLTHEEYFSVLRQIQDPHAKDIDFLHSLHAESFPQWSFELSQGFSTCLYGYGSKRRLLHQFATYLSNHSLPSTKIVIINGYVRTASLRETLSTIASAIDPSHKLTSAPPVAMTQSLLALLSSSPQNPIITLFINSIDAPPLRRTAAQSILAQLAAHPQIRLVCSADTPDFAFLWDSGLRSSFNFVFHDCTTFAPFDPAEIDVVDEVHEVLGRKARRVGGKEGVAFVLRSLPENAKSLFRLLVAEVLVAAADEVRDESEGAAGGVAAVEYRMVYQKAVEEFICSSEMAFRTLLKEFHDHQIITSHKDSLGTELLSLPFRKDELEAILEDLMS
ncbi:origin recognition complex subunit 2-domain-containing protein [Echria macrotheca]|uniref:Origin recognition complex subunit 2 n=1 Tax=Echria macrotheca TaxID=438768 RepID=A0AAJ0BQ25_9PEZI|nr:origin recognition complex subunit 2-domain-containing protein [Echria macrotheca]